LEDGVERGGGRGEEEGERRKGREDKGKEDGESTMVGKEGESTRH